MNPRPRLRACNFKLVFPYAPNCARARSLFLCRQCGASLIITLLMLLAVMLLGISSAQIVLQSEKASRNDRDRQIAFQAAEAALLDAELDLEGSAFSASRGKQFSKNSAFGFPGETEPGCGAGESNVQSLGLCSHAPPGVTPSWQSVNFLDFNASTTQSVSFGRFTGQTIQTGLGPSTRVLPRYVIELMLFNKEGEAADRVSYFYRITAIGFGVRESTQVVLQTLYRKET